jgi:hypothetical protein
LAIASHLLLSPGPPYTMNLEQAESLFRAYTELLRDPAKRGARRSPSLLPAPKSVLLRALRMLMAHLYLRGLDSVDELRPLTEAGMFLDSFNDEALDSLEFLAAMQQRRTELEDFHRTLGNIPRNDPFFWQRVYEMLGISTETKRSTFFEYLKTRLTRRVHTDRSVAAAGPQSG